MFNVICKLLASLPSVASAAEDFNYGSLMSDRTNPVLSFQGASMRNTNNPFLLIDGLISFCYIAFLTARIFKIKVALVVTQLPHLWCD